MLGLLEQERAAVAEQVSPTDHEPSPFGEGVESEGGYEIVLGRPQIASWMFFAMIAMGVVSAASFYAGKGSVSKPAAVSQVSPPPVQPPPATVVTPPPEATILRLPDGPVSRPGITDAPLFAQPEAGELYMQMGAVTKGMAVILAEGLRNHGFRSFVAPGPSVSIFRVLIGPLPDQESYRRAKAEADAIDLGTFARRFEVLARVSTSPPAALSENPSTDASAKPQPEAQAVATPESLPTVQAPVAPAGRE